MAWEMQSHMVHMILPSVEAYLRDHEDPPGEAGRILGYTLSEGITDLDTLDKIQKECDLDVARLGLVWAACTIAAHAERTATTDNGGNTFYCDAGGWCTIPWSYGEGD